MVSSSYQSLKKHFDTNCRIKEAVAHTSKVHSVDWNSDGRRLASGSFDKSVSLFSFSSDKIVKDFNFKGHTDSVDQLSWHPSNADILATASQDKTVRIWDAKSSKCTTIVETSGENININWSPDGGTLAVGNKDDIVSFIDTRSGKIKLQKEFKFEVNEFGWNKEGDLLFLTSGQGNLHILSYPSLEPVHIVNAHLSTLFCIEFDLSGDYFALGSADAVVSIWDTNNLACLRTISRLEWPARAISFSHDSQLLASASEDMFIDICYVETGEKIHSITTDSPTFTLAFHPKRHLLAYACDDKEGHQRGIIKIFGFKTE